MSEMTDEREPDALPAELIWNPLDPLLAQDPYPRYEMLRAVDPVYCEKLLGWWFVTGREEVNRVLREPGGELRYEWFQQMRLGGRDASQEPYCQGVRHFVPATSLEDHPRIRGTFRKHFTPNRVQAMREWIADTANELVDAFVADGRAELMEAFARPLPLASVSRLLDIAPEDQEQIAENLRHFLLAVQLLPLDEERLAKVNASIGGLRAHFTEIIARRRETLGEDLLSMLIREADDGVLSEEELNSNAWGLYAGGQDTTAGAICAAVAMLLTHPELERLQQDPSLIPGAVDEALRLYGPSQATHRIFDHELTVGGHTIPANTPIVVYLIAANRDPGWLERSAVFDVARTHDGQHLTFSNGPHKCPGQHLARMEMEIALETVITRLPGLRLDGEVEWDTENLPSLTPHRVPIAWDA